MATKKSNLTIIRRYSVSLCNNLLLYCELGNSRDSWIVKSRISPSAIIEWRKKHEEFFDTWQLALLAQKEYWETKLLENNKQALKMLEIINKQIQTDRLEKFKEDEPVQEIIEEVAKPSEFLSRASSLDITKG